MCCNMSVVCSLDSQLLQQQERTEQFIETSQPTPETKSTFVYSSAQSAESLTTILQHSGADTQIS